jgi:hypothetical protein
MYLIPTRCPAAFQHSAGTLLRTPLPRGPHALGLVTCTMAAMAIHTAANSQ